MGNSTAPDYEHSVASSNHHRDSHYREKLPLQLVSSPAWLPAHYLSSHDIQLVLVCIHHWDEIHQRSAHFDQICHRTKEKMTISSGNLLDCWRKNSLQSKIALISPSGARYLTLPWSFNVGIESFSSWKQIFERHKYCNKRVQRGTQNFKLVQDFLDQFQVRLLS